MQVDWKKYRRKLRAELGNRPGLILDADCHFQEVEGEATDRAAFKLTSGLCRKKFITLWEVFNHDDLLHDLLDKLTLKIQEVRQVTRFSTIVTCSPPAKYLVQLIHAAIEDRDPSENGSPEEEVRLYHMGAYPTYTRWETLKHFESQEVLIVTDVVATGTLIDDVANTIADLGGTPRAILAIVLTDEELMPGIRETEEAPKVAVGERPFEVRLHSLTDCRLPLAEGFDNDKLFEINPVTVLPGKSWSFPSPIQPLFDSPEEMFQHFEESKAIDFSFYEFGARRFTTALRLELLFERFGETIWQRLQDKIPPEALLVTTFNRSDLTVKQFVQSKLGDDDAESPECVLIPRKDDFGGSYMYFPPPRRAHHLKDRTVVLLLAAVQQAEKLRSLVSLLASQSVTEIIVICLINRMGRDAANFLSRIERLLRGIHGRDSKNGDSTEQPPPKAPTRFRFVAVYNITEVSSDDINRMQVHVAALFSRYSDRTPVRPFRRLVTTYRKYFDSRSVTSRQFLDGRPTSLEGPARKLFSGKEVTLHSEEGNLFLLTNNLVETQDYEPLIRELGRISHLGTLFKVFGLLLSDLRFIRLTRKFKLLREILRERIERHREERFRLEMEAPDGPLPQEVREAIADCIELEIHLLLGLALYSFYDHEFDYREYVLSALTCERDPERWAQTPENLLQYLGSEPLMWVLSMLLHLSSGGRPNLEGKEQFRDTLVLTVRRYIRFCEGLDQKILEARLPVAEKGPRMATRVATVRATLNLLLADVGVHTLRTPESVIRFLQREILARPVWHSPIDTDIRLLISKLEEVFEELNPPEGEDGQEDERLRLTTPMHPVPPRSYPPQQRVPLKRDERIPTREMQNLLLDGITAAGRLEEIADAADRLFEFTPISRKEAGEFALEGNGSKFERSVARLGDLLSQARIRNAISWNEVVEIKKLRREVIKPSLWDSESPLRLVLRSYAVPLPKELVWALQEASYKLTVLGFGDVWAKEIRRYSNLGAGWEVLADRGLLRELLRNVLSNVRHGWKGLEKKGQDFSEMIGTDLTLENEDGGRVSDAIEARWVVFTVVSKGEVFSGGNQDLKATMTLQQQKYELEKYGGSLDIGALPESGGTEVRLRLRSRAVLAAKLEKYEKEVSG